MKKLIVAIVVSLALSSALPAFAQSIQITLNGSTPSALGAKSNFSGHAVIAPLFPANEDTRATTGLVTFAPAARTVWHTHPAGQMLIVTSGKGLIQAEGQSRQNLSPGDVVWIPAGVKHWHGGSPTTGMSHIAVTYMRDGKNVDWLEPVTDQQFAGN